jgi:hypothetical protein
VCQALVAATTLEHRQPLLFVEAVKLPPIDLDTCTNYCTQHYPGHSRVEFEVVFHSGPDNKIIKSLIKKTDSAPNWKAITVKFKGAGMAKTAIASRGSISNLRVRCKKSPLCASWTIGHMMLGTNGSSVRPYLECLVTSRFIANSRTTEFIKPFKIMVKSPQEVIVDTVAITVIYNVQNNIYPKNGYILLGVLCCDIFVGKL